jgi:hypothetical protein
MKEGTVAIIIGAIVIGFLVVFRFNTQVATGQRILTPQPSQNYGGYLAASTAPSVATALNGLISGFGSAATSWLKGSPRTVVQGAPPSPSAVASPAGIAAPVGPQPNLQANFIAGLNTYSDPGSTLVGPQTNPAITYDATNGLAFDYAGLSGDNAYDPAASYQPSVA